ncbi:hypothetical protein AAKU55_005123 [Oxalobacteraceae bacterium GrIS 1.11]
MNHIPAPAQPSGHGGSSLYGQDMLAFVSDYTKFSDSALAVATYVMTHGSRYSMDDAIDALSYADLAAYKVLSVHPQLPLLNEVDDSVDPSQVYELYANSLGRLHIRPQGLTKPVYDEKDSYLDLGKVVFSIASLTEISNLEQQYLRCEDAAFSAIKKSMQELDEQGELATVLEEVIDHVAHVESVCFYVRDRFFALIDRFVNLIDTKACTGHLPRLRNKPFQDWENDDVLMVAALHALFQSGRSVRFEEFNGISLSADALLRKMTKLYERYVSLGCIALDDPQRNLFTLAYHVRKQTLQAVGKPWLRYRKTYGLNFQKTESVMENAQSTEDPLIYLKHFGDDYANLVSARNNYRMPEGLFFTQLASACLAQDIAGIAPPKIKGSAATSWLEALIEKIVASAINATNSDYGMSSSLRDIALLMEDDDIALTDAIHALTPANFFTCFVSRNFAGRLDASDANMIATSVQKRMMFNRWHFIPGNLERPLVLDSRHWYYPPLIPDIAKHADVHRAAHARARVKFSIRTPGPDMSRPSLRIMNHGYRGYYDVRIVRMDGQEYTLDDMVRCRRRTLWLEAVYGVLVSYLQETPETFYAIKGFMAGTYLDLSENNDLPVWSMVDASHTHATSVVTEVL